MRIPIAVAALLALAPTPAVALAATPKRHVPGATWHHVAPRAAGFDAPRLRRIVRQARAAHSICMAVGRDGVLAADWRRPGVTARTTQDVFSVTKSITSLLVGIAQDEGRLRVNDSASRWITEWRGTPSEAVTVRDLLSNDSGRQWSPQIDYASFITAPDRTSFAIGLGQTSAPGMVWAYNNSAIQTLERVLEAATGQDVARFARDRLFRPLGMTRTRMAVDRAGKAQMFEGAQSTCGDLARLGTLMVDDGRWGRRQIVSAGWIRAATGAPSQPINAAYGLLWWLNRRGVVATNALAPVDLAAATAPTAPRTRLVPGAPADLYWAIGLGNQIVQVDPGSRTVVVRLGPVEVRPTPPTFGPADAARVVTQALRRARPAG